LRAAPPLIAATEPLVTTFLRVLLGTAVYALIVVLAAPFPSAAGLMLVFPTLNGLAYVFSERGRVLAMAPSMLWMPVVNGVLCAAYLLLFLAFARAVPPEPLAWELTFAAILAFVLIVRQPWLRRGVPVRHQVAFALAASLVGIVLVAVAAALMWTAAPAAGQGALAEALSWRFVAATLTHNGVKIAIFALCLGAFLVATQVMPLSDGVRGILAGLPFAPFGGLVSIAGDGAIALAARLEIVRHMAVSVWLGPAIAIWFIYGFPRVLVRLRSAGTAAAVVALFAAWALAALAVAAATAALR
jgi:hypothetical protein